MAGKGKREDETSFDFEVLYRRWPRKEGKKAGMAKLKKEIKTANQYADLERAVENCVASYIADKTERRFMRFWSTFCNNWEDYVMQPEDAFGPASQLQRILRGQL